ncbi:MAG: hypothetical protein Q8O99_00600 [bacterium]|nr:hypothetical protein [bacterium]
MINYLATTDALGISMMQLGSIFPFPYMPPGWTFGIARGVIYLLLAVFVFVGRTQKGRESKLYQ